MSTSWVTQISILRHPISTGGREGLLPYLSGVPDNNVFSGDGYLLERKKRSKYFSLVLLCTDLVVFCEILGLLASGTESD